MYSHYAEDANSPGVAIALGSPPPSMRSGPILRSARRTALSAHVPPHVPTRERWHDKRWQFRFPERMTKCEAKAKGASYNCPTVPLHPIVQYPMSPHVLASAHARARQDMHRP
eukprot:9503875-Pyramimonas_sp.AAC.2